MWCERLRRGGTEAEGAAGAERKTRTPHSDVGNKNLGQFGLTHLLHEHTTQGTALHRGFL